MDNALSQILAEIFTSEAFNIALNNLPIGTFKFFGKYVDDLFAICNIEYIKDLQDEITKCVGGLKLKITTENDMRQVPYLDIIGVYPYNQIYFTWYQKPCSKKRILDFHSNHPINM